jgi:RNA polymerase sigma factor (sigma-70 family)
MEDNKLIPHLFRTEYSKITAVLCAVFGFEHIEVAEDIASDTFLSATEIWSLKGLPDNPVAWLYTVAKNKARNALKHQDIFNKKITRQLNYTIAGAEEPEIDLSVENIRDSQLQMIFAICHPAIPAEAQIGLALRILCGFGIGEIADAFLTSKETISKRLQRARDRLRAEKIKIEPPARTDIGPRLETVLRTLYLLFNEGYYSASNNSMLRKDLCFEAMRLTSLLMENEWTDLPAVNALFSLMCFQSSRLEARIDESGEAVLYDDQDTSRWDKELITRGEHFLNRASQGEQVSKYHLEAGIAYWHTIKDSTSEKWENILQLYNHLLLLEYSPIIALNRTYALSRANGKTEALTAALRLNLEDNHLYHVLLSDLYTDIDNNAAITHLQTALSLARSAADKTILSRKMADLTSSG